MFGFCKILCKMIEIVDILVVYVVNFELSDAKFISMF